LIFDCRSLDARDETIAMAARPSRRSNAEIECDLNLRGIREFHAWMFICAAGENRSLSPPATYSGRYGPATGVPAAAKIALHALVFEPFGDWNSAIFRRQPEAVAKGFCVSI